MLISCVVYQNGKKVADIATHEIHQYVGQPDCLVWVALREADAAALEEMRKEFGLHPLAVEDAQHGHQRPKIEEYSDSLFAVLHMIEPMDGEFRVGEVAIFAGGNYVLSARSHADKGFQDVRARCEREPELLRHGPGYVLYALMDAVVDRYFPILERLEDELERIEERIFAEVRSAKMRCHIGAKHPPALPSAHLRKENREHRSVVRPQSRPRHKVAGVLVQPRAYERPTLSRARATLTPACLL